MRRAAAVDANQTKIVAALRKAGAVVVLTHTLKNAFDILVGAHGQWIPCEIKDGAKLPKKYAEMTGGVKYNYLESRLTEGEGVFFDKAATAGLPTHIVSSTDEAIDMLLWMQARQRAIRKKLI